MILCAVFCLCSFALCGFVYDRISGRAFWDAYHRAQKQDLLYAREHPGCSLEEAHRERDKILRRYHRD